MASNRSTRISGVLIAAILILFAFFAILNANLLVWPLANPTGGSRHFSNSLTGELVVEASLAEPPQFLGGVSSGLSSFLLPIPNVNVSIFFPGQLTFPFISNTTDSNGYLSLNLSQGPYVMKVETPYSNLSAQISIIDRQITFFKLNVNESEHIATFYELSDLDAVGVVLPSQNVFLQINNTQPQLSSTLPTHLLTYSVTYFYPIVYSVSTTANYSSTTVGNSSTFGNFTATPQAAILLSQELPATIVSISAPSAGSIWVTVKPELPLNTTGVSYVAVSNFITTYTITNLTSGVVPL